MYFPGKCPALAATEDDIGDGLRDDAEVLGHSGQRIGLLQNDLEVVRRPLGPGRTAAAAADGRFRSALW